MTELHYNTVSPLLLDILKQCMTTPILNSFRLVGGTALSLQRGHRISYDIDLFTAASYDSIDFEKIDHWCQKAFPYVETNDFLPIGMGKCYFIGKNETENIKLDLYYTDSFFDNVQLTDGIRMATIHEIIAMKMDVILRNGRKKDFWDIHELLEDFSLEEMFDQHKKRYIYSHDRELLIQKIIDFRSADDDFEPNCRKGKHWELIKLDLLEAHKELLCS